MKTADAVGGQEPPRQAPSYCITVITAHCRAPLTKSQYDAQHNSADSPEITQMINGAPEGMKEEIKLFTFNFLTQNGTLTVALNDVGVALRLY